MAVGPGAAAGPPPRWLRRSRPRCDIGVAVAVCATLRAAVGVCAAVCRSALPRCRRPRPPRGRDRRGGCVAVAVCLALAPLPLLKRLLPRVSHGRAVLIRQSPVAPGRRATPDRVLPTANAVAVAAVAVRAPRLTRSGSADPLVPDRTRTVSEPRPWRVERCGGGASTSARGTALRTPTVSYSPAVAGVPCRSRRTPPVE